MGNESSQPEKTAAEIAQRGGRVFGPVVSPFFSSDERSETGRMVGPPLSPLSSQSESNQPNLPSPGSASTKKKKKREKREKSKKERSRHKKRKGVPSSDAQELLVSHAIGGSPPSAQRPTINGILEYAPELEADMEEEAVLPSSHLRNRRRGSMQSQASEIDDRQLETKTAENNNEQPQLHFSGNFTDVTRDPTTDATHESNSSSSAMWLHKRELVLDEHGEPITDTRTSQEMEDEALPDLESSQGKSEPESDLESGSPSAARLERLERSRSRSASRASTAISRLADQDLELRAPSASRQPLRASSHISLVERTTPSAPSSTGSNVSIPARLPNGVRTSPSEQESVPAEIQRLGENIAGDDVYPADAAQGVDDAGAATAAYGNAMAAHEKSVEPGESASQPKRKGKRKRNLQPKNSLSLSQIEGDDISEGQSRLSGISQSQRSKLKDIMRAGSNEPEGSEFALDQSQEPTPLLKPKKSKRKRRSPNDPSEDEMESILAAGPSGASKRSSKSLGLIDDEGVRAAKRKKLSKNEKATGPWSHEELGALGRVVNEFREANDMTQHEVNAMIHEKPNKANNPLHREFWDAAAAAVSRRSRKQITERTRRLYNNFTARGTWTDEQKEELHELFEEHGTKFAEIAGLINRHHQDVRDYWRNHYLVHETQIKARWTKEEEERLREVIEEALHKIRIMRENNDQFRPTPRATGGDDEALLDWQQISAAMGLTRSRQQCKWKWTDMREKGVAGEDSIFLPRSRKLNNGIREELANAREDFRRMSTEEKLRLVEAIHDSGAGDDGRIRWNTLVDERFRMKWKRPVLKLTWHRLRQTVPKYDLQDVQSNARFLLNYFNIHESLPTLNDNQVDEEAEERLVTYMKGGKVWKKTSDDPRAMRERQRRSSSVGNLANDRLGHNVSSKILRIEGSEDEDGGVSSRARRSDSVDLGLEDGEEQPRGRGIRRENREDVPIRIPKHLKGVAAKKALAEARAKAQSRSASVAIDSDSGSD